MTLLFITQKLSGQDAFTVLWIRGFIRRGYTVKVICLEKPLHAFEFEVHDLGKGLGLGLGLGLGPGSKLLAVLRFWKLIMTLTYDRVFIHMAPVWYVLGFLWWLIRRTAVYLWYTHYKWQIGIWLFGLFGKRFFCATEQSLPQFAGSPKKVVTGHGIDLNFWIKRENHCSDPHRLLIVHRLSRSKRIELCIRAFRFLPKDYTLDIYGIEAEPDYVAELTHLVTALHLESRVTFHGTVPMASLPGLYAQHRLILNMASETIDKTMLEAMTCGCYPVTTARNAAAIPITASPDHDTPEAIAEFIERHQTQLPMSAEAMYRVVAERHSLAGLIAKMDRFIRAGT